MNPVYTGDLWWEVRESYLFIEFAFTGFDFVYAFWRSFFQWTEASPVDHLEDCVVRRTFCQECPHMWKTEEFDQQNLPLPLTVSQQWCLVYASAPPRRANCLSYKNDLLEKYSQSWERQWGLGVRLGIGSRMTDKLGWKCYLPGGGKGRKGGEERERELAAAVSIIFFYWTQN